MKTKVEILKGGREFLSDPSHWIKGYSALTVDGLVTGACCEDAACCCSLGALWRANGGMDGAEYEAAEKALTRAMGMWPADFNDRRETTHADVLAAFDRAIAEESYDGFIVDAKAPA